MPNGNRCDRPSRQLASKPAGKLPGKLVSKLAGKLAALGRAIIHSDGVGCGRCGVVRTREAGDGPVPVQHLRARQVLALNRQPRCEGIGATGTRPEHAEGLVRCALLPQR